MINVRLVHVREQGSALLIDRSESLPVSVLINFYEDDILALLSMTSLLSYPH
jgi:hypothetical protein